MELSCGTCKTRLQVAAENAGQYVKCSACGAQVLVPAAPDAPPKPRPAAAGEAPKTDNTVQPGARTSKAPAKGAAALDSIKKLDSELEQAGCVGPVVGTPNTSIVYLANSRFLIK